MIPLDLPKTGSLENNLIFGRTPLDLGLSSQFPFSFQKFKNKIRKKKKEKKKKPTHFSGKGVLHTPRELHQLLPSLNPLGEVLRKDAPAFLQLLVLVPVTLLHAHEPAFILRVKRSTQVTQGRGQRALKPCRAWVTLETCWENIPSFLLIISSSLSHPPERMPPPGSIPCYPRLKTSPG